MNLRSKRHVLAAGQLNVIELERHLRVLAIRARLHLSHMAYELRSLGDLGPVGSFYRCIGLDYYAVAGFGGL